MNILMSCNTNYFLPTLVTMLSVLKNNPCTVTFYVLHSSLATAQLERMNSLVEESGHGTVKTVSVSADKFSGKKAGLSWLPPEANYRLLAQKLLPDTVDRFLWLDSDIIVRGNIEDFYNQDLEGMLLCACSYRKDGEIPWKWLEQILPKDTRYFNSGIYLADLAGQRKCINPEIYETYLYLFEKQLCFSDQDILNIVFSNRVKYADEFVYDFIPSELDNITAEQRSELRKKCKVIHYNGKNGKPWLPQYAYLWGRPFWDYAEQLPEFAGKYAHVRPEQKKSRAKFLRLKKKYIAGQEKKESSSLIIF